MVISIKKNSKNKVFILRTQLENMGIYLDYNIVNSIKKYKNNSYIILSLSSYKNNKSKYYVTIDKQEYFSIKFMIQDNYTLDDVIKLFIANLNSLIKSYNES